MKAKKEILASAVGLPMLAALLIGSGDPSTEISTAAYWAIEAACLIVIVAGAFIIRRIYKPIK